MHLKGIKNSIRKKLILLLISATVIPIVTSMIITYQYTTEEVKKQTIAQNINLIYQGKTNLLFYFDFINRSSTTVYNNAYLNDTLYKIIEWDLRDFQSEQQISRDLSFMYRILDEIEQVDIYIQKSKRSYLMSNNRFLKASGVETYLKPLSEGYEGFIEEPHIIHNYGVSKLYFSGRNKKQTVISFHRPIYKVPTKELLGYISIDVKTDALFNIFQQLYTQGEEELYVIDNNTRAVIYHSEDSGLGQTVHESWFETILNKNDAKGSFDVHTDEFNGIAIYEKVQAPYMNWTIVKRIPYRYLYKNANDLTKINSQIIAIFLIIVVAITAYISIYFTKPIKQLIDSIGKIRKGNLEEEIRVERHDEFGILQRHFKQMMETINRLILHEYRLEISNKTMELKALQAQINPHFLNNALQSIGTLALKANAPQVYKLILALAQMMRYNMNTQEMSVSFAKEMEHVKAYLDLQKQRFNEDLEVVFDIEEETKQVEVPKMILQPLVENYFKHGFEKQGGQGYIEITSKMVDKNQMILCVKDNGSGISDRRMEIIQRQMNKSMELRLKEKEHIGLMNVVDRLQLFFGEEEVKLELKHAVPTGLIIEMIVPIKKKQRESSKEILEE